VSVINVLRQSTGVHMLTDGLAFSRDGRAKQCCKIAALPHLPAVVSVRGPVMLMPILAEILGGNFRTYDDMKAGIAKAVPASEKEIRAMLSANEDVMNFEINVAGISRSVGSDSFFLRSDSWVVQDPGPLLIGPIDEAISNAVISEFARRGGYDALDPIVDGVRMIEIQREHWSFGEDQLPGGFVQHACVDLDGTIKTSIVHRWPQRPNNPGRSPGSAVDAVLVGAQSRH
jgi:hypothetical protein